MNTGLHDCSACGAKDSAYGDNFCGKCEGEYHRQQDEYAQSQIDRLQEEINDCCAGRGDEYCQRCHRRYAQILSWQGKEDQAESYLNQ